MGLVPLPSGSSGKEEAIMEGTNANGHGYSDQASELAGRWALTRMG